MEVSRCARFRRVEGEHPRRRETVRNAGFCGATERRGGEGRGGTEDAKRKTRATKPRRRAKNAPTKRAPELSKEEKAVFTALNERILRCASAEAIGDVLAEKDALLSDVNIATIFSLLGKKCNAKKTKDGDALGWNALAVERLITSGAFQEKVLSPCEKGDFTRSSRIVSTIFWSVARMKQSKVKFVENGGFEAAWMSLESGLERVCEEQRTLLFEKIFPEYMPPKSCAKDRVGICNIRKNNHPRTHEKCHRVDCYKKD